MGPGGLGSPNRNVVSDPQRPVNFSIDDLPFRDLAPILVFEAGYDEIKLQSKIMTSFQ